MRLIVERCRPGIALALIALIASVALSAGTSLRLGWHWIAMLALGMVAIISIVLALPPGLFRPLLSPGHDIADIAIRTGEMERHNAHLDMEGGKRRSRFLWNLLPLAIAFLIIATLR